MNMDSSYLQYINNLMSEEGGFELPTGRRMSIGSNSDFGSVLGANDIEELGAHIDLVTKERALSWGDGGFEEFIQAFSRKRTMSDASDWEGRLGNLQAFPAPAHGYSYEESPTVPNREPMQMPGALPPPSMLPPSAADISAQQQHFQLNSTNNFQIPHQFQLLLQSGSFLPNGTVGTAAGASTMMLPVQEQQEVRIGAYTRAERQIRIAKYRAKREKRIYKKQIKYDCRKKLADTRPRIKGRFVTKVGDEDGEGDGCREETRGDSGSAEASGAGPTSNDNCSVDSPRQVTMIHAETSCESFSLNKPVEPDEIGPTSTQPLVEIKLEAPF